MNKKSGKNTKKWLETKAFYAVAISLVLVIVGISAAIINISKIKNVAKGNEDEPATYYSVTQMTEFQANKNATGIADERETTEEATEEATTAEQKFTFPLNSNVIKDYSDGNMVYSKTMGDWRIHNGVDIGGEENSEVVAIQNGNVLDAYNDELWGDVVVIQHQNGLEAKYCGVKSVVQKGQSVEQGQTIGTLGVIPIENADGLHVHLEIKIEEANTDPIKAMNMLSADAGVME